MQETARIILPLPPAILSPNSPPGSRGGRFARAAAVKKCRRLAREATEAERISSGPWDKTALEITFFHSQNRRRDTANYISSLKGYIDGVVDSGLIKDDCHECLIIASTEFIIDKDFPRVELVFKRVDKPNE